MTGRDGPTFDPKGRRLVYQAIADVLEQRVRDGTYPPDGRLPAELDLVAEFGAARETVRQAVRLLVSRGLVEVVHGKGSYVRPPEEWPPAGD